MNNRCYRAWFIVTGNELFCGETGTLIRLVPFRGISRSGARMNLSLECVPRKLVMESCHWAFFPSVSQFRRRPELMIRSKWGIISGASESGEGYILDESGSSFGRESRGWIWYSTIYWVPSCSCDNEWCNSHLIVCGKTALEFFLGIETEKGKRRDTLKRWRRF